MKSFKDYLIESTERDRIEQRDAALPIEKGGLGLSSNNTKPDREKAYIKGGLDKFIYRYGGKDIKSLKKSFHPTILVDGLLRHRHNSLNNPIHHTDEGIINFHRWFGDSQVIDEHGRPKVVYHGSRSPDKNFNVFLPNKGGYEGHYFSDSESFSKKFGDTRPFYLKIENPEKNGFDGSGVGAAMTKSPYRDGGIFTKRQTDKYANKGAKEYIVFDPHQIKSIHNDGHFTNSDNINENVFYKITTKLLESLYENLKPTVTVGDITRHIVLDDRVKDNHIVYVKSDNFDKAYAKDKDFYIGRGGLNGIKNRYQRFNDWFTDKENKDPLIASMANVDDNGNVSFDNGRHRYAWMRDNGLDRIPVSMSSQSILNAKRNAML